MCQLLLRANKFVLLYNLYKQCQQSIVNEILFYGITGYLTKYHKSLVQVVGA